ncbi:MAG: glycosyltransferase [Candidatus Cloacimonetes bacterium]|nr:glycosyltransferase [Candidatus Cloacimonadota bacterium]
MNTISMVGTLPPNKGISDTCLEQVKYLSKKFKVVFIDFKQLYPEFLYPGGSKDTSQAPKIENVKIINILTWYNPFSWISAAYKVKGRTLHMHWWTYYLFMPLFTILITNKLRGKKTVCNVHNVEGHESNILDKLLTMIFLKNVDQLIVHANDNKEKIHKNYKINKSKISVIPIGIPEFFVKDDVSKTEGRKKLGIKKKKKVILNFGNIRDYKGIYILLEAFNLIKKKNKDAFLIIAGKPWVDWTKYQNIIDKYNLKNDILLNLDYIAADDVKYYFRAADILVLPYKHFDAQSGPGRIALGFELPMVVSDVGGLPDLVMDKKCIAKPGDIDGFAISVNRIINNKRLYSKLLLDSKILKKKLGWDNIIEKNIKLYLSLDSK